MEVNMKITKKIFNHKYRKALGEELSTDVDLYNEFTNSDIDKLTDIVFIVFSNEESICTNKPYIITGIGTKEYIDWSSRVDLKDRFKYLYEVSLISTEYYCQLSGASCFKGKCKEEKRYKLNFDYTDYKNSTDITNCKNTLFDFVKQQKMQIDNNIGLELLAIVNYNYRLLENVYRLKSLNISEPVDRRFRKALIQKIYKCNSNKIDFENNIGQISTMKSFVKYMKTNRNDILQEDSEKESLHRKNDNVIYTYPHCLTLDNTYIDFFVNNEFNSAAPFYYQYRNYKIATVILLDGFMNDFIEKTKEGISNILQVLSQNETINESHIKIDKSNFGLYFPLFMNFRHSIELSFKLIYINECVKKQLKSLKECSKDLKNHDLLLLLDLVRPYLEEYISSEELDFYDSLCSFITYFEHKDASFSRYIINNELDFEALEKINMYCKDLTNYILEFYEMMDETLSKIDFGFEFDNIFTQ